MNAFYREAARRVASTFCLFGKSIILVESSQRHPAEIHSSTEHSTSIRACVKIGVKIGGRLHAAFSKLFCNFAFRTNLFTHNCK